LTYRAGGSDLKHKFLTPKALRQRRSKLIERLKRAGETLSRVEGKYQGLLENTADIIYTHDLAGNMLSINHAAEKIYGYSQEEFKRLNLKDFVDKEYLSVAFANIKRMADKNAQGSPQEYLTYAKNGARVWVEVNTHGITDGDTVIFIQGIARDITLRKKYEEALGRSEKDLKNKIDYLNALISNMNELFYTYDQEARITFINNKCLEVVGYTPDNMLGRKIIDFVPDEHKETVMAGIQNRLVNGLPGSYEVPVLHKNGSWRIIKLNVSPIIEASGITGGMVVADDITDRKKAEEELLLSREWFFKAFNASPSIMIIYDHDDGRIIDVNSAFVNILGYSRTEAMGKTPPNLCFWKDKNEQDKIRRMVTEKKQVRNREVHFITKSGDARIGLYSAEAIDIRGNRYILLSINDITELRQMEKELYRLEQLNLVGEMAAGMGHEIRNPMTAVRGFLQILGGKKDFQDYREYFDLMIDELDRMNAIISEFLSLAKNKLVVLKSSNLNTVISSIVPLINADAAIYDKTVRLSLDQLPHLLLDENEIRQLLLNLCRNGLEAMEPGGLLTIKTSLEDTGVILSVQDQGFEIPATVLDKMGTPFFTTKEKGTGLGLAVCHSIAARHNALIKVETSPAGTTFYVCFTLNARHK
jgi:PAS domain S-box-containing protein